VKVLVCGGRYYDDATTLFRVMDRIHAETPITMVIHGDAPGADTLAGAWTIDQPAHINLRIFPADWSLYGRRAGPIRNKQMLAEGKPDLVVAFPGGAGTTSMVRLARNAGVRVMEIDGKGRSR